MEKADIERMVNEAKLHEEEDKKLKEVVEKRNSLDSLIMQIEKTASESKDKIPAEEIEKVEKALEDAKLVLKEKAEDGEALKQASDDLIQASHKMAEILYKEKQAEAGAPEGADATGDAAGADTQPEDKGPIDTNAE